MEYRYGMRLRGFAPFCQPMNGLKGVDETYGGKRSGERYHDILIYNRPLTEAELREYELDPLQ